jgi:hypothetical protein
MASTEAEGGETMIETDAERLDRAMRGVRDPLASEMANFDARIAELRAGV